MTTMALTVKLFAALADAAGTRELPLVLPEGTTAGELRERMARDFPGLAGLLARAAVAVNRAYAPEHQVLRAGDEVALIPPVSGGAGRALVTSEPLDARALEALVSSERAGAVVTFTGVVRGITGERRTLRLEYEAYAEMATERLEAVCAEAEAHWPGVRAAVAHRTGPLAVGEASVVIAVASPHRRAGFAAAAYIIDRIKETVPVWKREVFADGSEWVEGRPPVG